MSDVFANPAVCSAEDIELVLRQMADGDFIRARRIGGSVLGRDISVLEIGAMHRPALFVGGTHGMEWASALTVLRLAQETVNAVRAGVPVHGMDLRNLLATRGVLFLPLLNPDGYEIRRHGAPQGAAMTRFNEPDFRYWQANARGVDINHNFNAGFYKAARMVAELGIRRPGPTRYGGLFPFSEPESRAVRRLCECCRPRSLFSLHSQGEEIYWRYGTTQPAGSAYIAGLVASLTGYTLCDPDTVASHAGLKDWFIKRYNLPGFTIELGLGENPLPYDDFEPIWERVERALFVGMIV